MKEQSSIETSTDSLIRDLDTLCVQEEVDLIIEHGFEKNNKKIPAGVLANEYAKCLAYNDNHKQKIEGFYCNYLDHSDSIDIPIGHYGVLNIMVTFSDRTVLIYSLDPVAAKHRERLLYAGEYIVINNKSDEIYFNINKSVFDSFFNIIRDYFSAKDIPYHYL